MRQRFSALGPLVIAMLGLASCGDSSGPEGLRVFTCNAGTRYIIGGTRAGTLTTRDCRDPVSGRLGDYYQFTLSSPGPVAIEVLPLPAMDDMHLILYRDDGSVIEAERTSIRGTAMVGGTLAAGTYVLVVQPHANEMVGAGGVEYLLVSGREAPPPFDCGALVPHPVGSTVQGPIIPFPCVNEQGTEPADLYQVVVSQEGWLRVTLQANAATSGVRVALYTMDEIALAADAVPAGTTVTVEARVVPATYLIMVEHSSVMPAGSYTMSTTLAPP